MPQSFADKAWPILSALLQTYVRKLRTHFCVRDCNSGTIPAPPQGLRVCLAQSELRAGELRGQTCSVFGVLAEEGVKQGASESLPWIYLPELHCSSCPVLGLVYWDEVGHIRIRDVYHQRAVLNWELKFYFGV